MKTPLKTILLSALATLMIFASVMYTSCNRDKCKTINCAHGGVCNSGICICPSGYSGTNCETITRQKFIGNWQVFEKGSITNAAQYPISIQASTAPNALITDVVIKNFYNYFTSSIKGIVSGDTLYIPNQQLEGKVIFGVGFIYTNVTYGQYGSISMSYEVVDTATNIPNDFGYYPPDLSAPSAWNK
jgi:hypothetical protein